MNKLWTGALIGTVVGAGITLFDRETRNEVVHGVESTSRKMKQYVQHPSYTLELLNQKYHTSMSNHANDLIYVMDQIQYVLESIENIEEQKKD
ncbi:YtxH domain-containing protein [Bacillaceae bacterium S4-13-56]